MMEPRTDSERLASMETILTRMEHRLFGNGQPGEIHSIKSRITKLENWRFWVVGVAVGAGVALGWISKGAIAGVVK